jgi:uroporphyrin-3 C-methyltransferase
VQPAAPVAQAPKFTGMPSDADSTSAAPGAVSGGTAATVDATLVEDKAAAASASPPATDAASTVPDTKPAPAPVAHKKTASEKAQKPGVSVPVKTDEIDGGSMLRTVQAVWTRWWTQLTEHVSVATRDLVRVSRIDEPDAVLLSPEQAVFLRENLKLRLLNARLSLLSRQVAASRADMQAVKTAMLKYFDPQSPVNKQAQQALGDVLQASKSLELPRPDDTLAALAKAAGGR